MAVAELDPTREELAAKRAQLIADLKLTLEARFVPWSQSRNKNETDERGNPRRSLNWVVTLKRDGRTILETDYMQGIGHAPSYKKFIGKNRDWAAIIGESEHGRTGYNPPFSQGRKVPAPPLEDVLYSLLLDSDVLDCGGFDDWAANYGYDADSRKAESIFKACIDTALKLRAGLGEKTMADLRDAFQDY